MALDHAGVVSGMVSFSYSLSAIVCQTVTGFMITNHVSFLEWEVSSKKNITRKGAEKYNQGCSLEKKNGIAFEIWSTLKWKAGGVHLAMCLSIQSGVEFLQNSYLFQILDFFISQSIPDWINCFYLAAAISALGAIIFTLFGSSEAQPWALTSPSKKDYHLTENDWKLKSTFLSVSIVCYIYIDHNCFWIKCTYSFNVPKLPNVPS